MTTTFCRWSGDGNSQRTYLPRLAGRVSTHRTPRLLFPLRGIHPHRGLHSLTSTPSGCRRPPKISPGVGQSLLSPAHLSCLAARPQRFQSPRPGFIDLVVNKKADAIRVPASMPTLLSVTNHCLRSRNYVNVIAAVSNLRCNTSPWMKPSSTARGGLGIWSGHDQGCRA